MLVKDIKAMLVPEWEEFNSKTPLEKIILKESVFYKRLDRQYSPINSIISSIIDLVEESSVITIVGESGSGKTSLMSHLVCRFSKLFFDRFDTFPIFCGMTEETSDIIHILEAIHLFLNEYKSQSAQFITTKKSNDRDCYKSMLYNIQRTLTFGLEYNVCIIIDSIENLPWNERIMLADAIVSISDMCPNIIFVVSTESEQIVRILHGKRVDIPHLINKSEKEKLIEGALGRHKVDGSVIEALINRNGSESAIYLSFLTRYIGLLGEKDFDEIYAKKEETSLATLNKQMELINNAPDDFNELILDFIGKINQRVGGNLTIKALVYIASSLNGLKISELIDLIPDNWDYLDLIRVINYCSDMFVQRSDGRYLFSNRKIANAVLHTYNDEKKEAVHKNLLKHLEEGKDKKLLNPGEYLFQCVKSNNYNEFVSVVQKFQQNPLLVYRIIEEYGAEWIAECVLKTEIFDEHLSFWNFICNDVYQCSSFSDFEINKMLLVLQALEKRISNVSFPNKEIEEFHVVVFDRLGELYDLKGDKDKVITYYGKIREYYMSPRDNSTIDVVYTCNKVTSLINYANAIRETDEKRAFADNKEALRLMLELCYEIGDISIKCSNGTYMDIMQELSLTYNNMAIAYYTRGSFDTAICYEIEDFRIVEMLYEKKKTEDSFCDYADSCEFMGELYCLKKDFIKAKPYLKKALELYNKLDKNYHKEIYRNHKLGIERSLSKI